MRVFLLQHIMNDIKFNIAILIDGDNAQASLLKEIISEVSKYGKATIRRIYGDWTSSQMNSWKETLNTYSINPIQKFAYTSGKNSTDSSLIIDAMDILHNGSVDGFCIVSSDSDYTGLAKRIREEGMFVMGIGRKSTPIPFVNSCEIFTFTENLTDTPEEESKVRNTNNAKSKTSTASEKRKTRNTSKNSIPKQEMQKIDKAFEIATNEDEETFISKIGSSLRKIDPSFDPRTFGFKNLTQLFDSLGKYEIVKNEVNGLNHPLVRKK